MIKWIEGFLFGKVFGRVLARLALSAVAGIAGFLASQGIDLTPEQQAAAVTSLISAANGAYTKISAWRKARAAKAAPASDPAVDKPL